jgi:hypothetical protein
MPTAVGPNTKGEENLVFGYDLGDARNSYKGEPTTNYITTMAANLGGNVSLSYPLNVYICTAQETNVADPTAPGGQYSRFTGNTDSDNNQLFTSFVDGSVNARNTTVAYSVYLKGTGTCHLTVYSDIAGYSTTPTITLTSKWTRYSIVQAVGNYTTHAWVAVRGILTSTNVYVAAQQIEFNSHITPFVNGTRSATQGLIDLTGNSTIDLTNVSFDSNAQMTFDGSNDIINLGSSLNSYNTPTIEAVFKSNSASGTDFKVIIGWGAFSSGNYSGIHLGAGTSAYPDESLTVWINGQTLQMAVRKGHGYYHDNKYHHVVVTLAPGANKIYIDGVEETVDFDYGSVNTNSGGFSQTNNVTYIGRRSYSSGYFFNGPIPLLKVYNRALTASEVKSNYNAIKGRFNI